MSKERKIELEKVQEPQINIQIEPKPEAIIFYIQLKAQET
jgi:hypothetical protein